MSFVVSFEFGDAFMLGYKFLEVAAALSGGSRLQKLRNQLKYLADSKIMNNILSLMFGGKDALIMVNK